MKNSPRLEELIDALEASRAFTTKLAKGLIAAKAGDGWDAIAVSKVLESAVKSPPARSDFSALIARALPEAEREASTSMLELEADLRELCDRRQWELYGQWPTLYVERAIEVSVDERKRIISVAGASLKGFGRTTIEKAIEKEVSTLLPRGFDASKFMASLCAAYDDASGGSGGQVPLVRVYRSFIMLSQAPKFWHDARASKFLAVTATQFRARLSAALEAGATACPDGRELRLLPPIDPKDAMFVYQPAESRFGFVGRIEFRLSEDFRR